MLNVAFMSEFYFQLSEHTIFHNGAPTYKFNIEAHS